MILASQAESGMAKLQSAASVVGKETIYVDVDDEITTVIDKVRNAKSKVVALVLPKRATVLQSIVNMKLLKRTADNASKNLVLVTSEAGLMPLAGSVGLYVADTPTSKPVIPPVPVGPTDEPEDIDEPLDIVDGSGADDFDANEAAATPVGDLAVAGAASKIPEKDIDEDIDLGDSADAAVPAAAAAAASAAKPKKNKRLAVPNFDSFRKKLLLAAGVLVLLIVAGIFAFVVLPKAKITVHTNSSAINSNLNLQLDTAAKALDMSNSTVPATAQSQQKTATQTVPATGQQNNGQTASGSVKFSVQKCSGTGNPSSIPTGSSVTSDGKTYITQQEADFSPSSVNYPCVTFSSNSVGIQALKAGAAYNTDTSATFTASSGATGSGSASGGTDDITKVVAQSDIDGATSKIKSTDNSSVKQQLTSSLRGKGLQPVEATFLAGTPQVTTSAKAGDATDNVTVTAVTSYNMLGVQKSDLQKLVDANVNKQIDQSKQTILDDGVSNAVFNATTTPSPTNASVAMAVKSVAGPQLNVGQLQKQLAGKKTGDVKSLLNQTPGVTDVDVHYSPFWVSSVPKSTKKITIIIDKPSTKQ